MPEDINPTSRPPAYIPRQVTPKNPGGTKLPDRPKSSTDLRSGTASPETVAARNFTSQEIPKSAVLDSTVEMENMGKIEIYKNDNGNGSITYFVKNNCYLPLEGKFEITGTNVNTGNKNVSIPKRESGERGAQVEAFTIKIQDKSKAWNYSYSYNVLIGSSKSKHDSKKFYSLPFKEGNSFACGQGEHGTKTHTGNNEFALDFDMPEGTPVCAMRSGTVVSIKSDSNEGGINVDSKKGNFIWVMHDDESVAKYVHLKQNGASVKIGEKINQGELIGYSGSTGQVDKPHLHVQLDVPKGYNGTDLISIQFKDKDGKPFQVEEGKTYTR